MFTLRAAPFEDCQCQPSFLSHDCSRDLLNSAAGESVNVPLECKFDQADLVRLQSDATLLALSTAVLLGVTRHGCESLGSGRHVLYADTRNGGVRDGQRNHLEGCTGHANYHNLSFPLVVVRGQNIGLAISIDIEKALSVNGQSQAITSVNLGAANVLTAMMLPPASSSLPATPLDFIEDVTGLFSSVDEGTQRVTIQTATRGPITANANNLTIVSPTV